MSKNRVVKSHRKFTEENIIDIDTAQKHFRPKKIELIPRTQNQEKLVMALADPKQHIVVTTGPAGTGKTYLATLRAIQALREGECKRIMLVRPAVAVDGESHGFLPGDLNQKLEPWCLPLLDILHEFYKPHEVSKMISDKVIEMAPLSMMRGRTLRDVFLIADEMQNASPNQCLMLLTRIGENSKFVFTGDVAQTDKRVGFNGLLDICAKLEQTPIDGISLCTFNERDIQRHPLIGKILKLYGE